jgi:hypothetical protein
MSNRTRSLHDIAATGDAEALSAMLIGEVDVNMADRVSNAILLQAHNILCVLHG